MFYLYDVKHPLTNQQTMTFSLTPDILSAEIKKTMEGWNSNDFYF